MAKAQGLFLAGGYEAFSYDAMAAELGLAKPSLYNAFGPKDALFVRALNDYATKSRAQIAYDFSGARNLAAAASKLLLAAARHYSRPDGPSRGCLLVGTALPACVALDAPRKTLADFIAALERDLARVIAAEHKTEAARRGRKPEMLAMLVTSLLFSLAVRARAGVSRRKLAAIARDLAATFA